MAVVFILNSKSRKKNLFYRALNSHKPQALDVEIWETKKKLHAPELTTRAVTSGFSHIIAVGGDGTLHEVLNGLITSLSSCHSDQPQPLLGLLPLGSANDFARGNGITFDLDKLFFSIKNNHWKEVYYGKIERDDQCTYFLNIATVGFGAEVVKHVNAMSGYWGSHLQFIRGITKSFFSYKKGNMQCRTADYTWSGKTLLIVVANSLFFGSGLSLTPNAHPDSPEFHVAIVADISIHHFFRYLPALKTAQPIRHPEIHYLKGKEIEINSGKNCYIEADGELVGIANAIIKIGGTIRMLKP